MMDGMDCSGFSLATATLPPATRDQTPTSVSTS